MSDLLDKAKQWRKCAEDARTIADGMRNHEAKRIMLNLAASYEVLVKRAECCGADHEPLRRS